MTVSSASLFSYLDENMKAFVPGIRGVRLCIPTLLRLRRIESTIAGVLLFYFRGDESTLAGVRLFYLFFATEADEELKQSRCKSLELQLGGKGSTKGTKYFLANRKKEGWVPFGKEAFARLYGMEWNGFRKRQDHSIPCMRDRW